MTKSTSATISQEEFEALRKRDPFEALDLMLNGNIFSSRIDTRPSTGVASDLSEISKATLLEELRTKVLKVDLFQAVEQDESIIPRIKTLLRKLTNSSLDSKFVKFYVKLEPILDQIAVDLHQKKNDQAKLANQIKRRDELMVEVEKYKKKIYSFKQEVPNVKKKMEEYDLAISKHEAEIQESKSKKESLMEKDGRLKKEANPTIKKVEETKRHDAEVAKFADEGKILDT